jgi:hypothetical protein
MHPIIVIRKAREPEPPRDVQNCDVRGSRRNGKARKAPSEKSQKCERREREREKAKSSLVRENCPLSLSESSSKLSERAKSSSRTKINCLAFRVLYLLLHARYTQSSASRCKDLLPHFMLLTDDAHEDC